MQSSGMWKRTLATGLISSALFAGAAFGADNRMQAQRSVTNRRLVAESPRVVGFKTERTDSWLCEYVSPFFCSTIPTVVASPQPGPASPKQRGRR
jgi:hypothetical protein